MNMHEEIMLLEMEYDELKFRTTREKVDYEVLIDRLKKEALFLRADAEEIKL